jgi:DNA-binding CsgD family transcriptional regulator
MELIINSQEFRQFAQASAEVMNKLILPLKSCSHITNFSYLKYYTTGKVINWSTDINWTRLIYANLCEFQKVIKQFISGLEFSQPYLDLWLNVEQSSLLTSLKNYGICNGCNIYLLLADSCEIFSFASTTDYPEISNYYVNNFAMLSGFIIDFKSKLSKLEKSVTSSINLTDKLTFPGFKLDPPRHKKDTYFKLTNQELPKKILLSEELHLSSRELICVYYLMHGLSIKQIAWCIGASPRTVESHLSHCKYKTGSDTSFELIAKLQPYAWALNSLFADATLKLRVNTFKSVR